MVEFFQQADLAFEVFDLLDGLGFGFAGQGDYFHGVVQVGGGVQAFVDFAGGALAEKRDDLVFGFGGGGFGGLFGGGGVWMSRDFEFGSFLFTIRESHN